MTTWLPPSGRDHASAGLHDGVPDWLKETVWEWIWGAYTTYDFGGYETDDKALARLERLLRIQFDWGSGGSSVLERTIKRLVYSYDHEDQTLALDVVHHTVDQVPTPYAEQLDKSLEEGGSAWRVAEREGALGLERRVAEAVAAAADQAMETPGNAGQLLERAWSATYGRRPRPNEAYADAVRAVEAAAQPIVTPDDKVATLGKMIAAMRDAPEKWSTPFQPKDGTPDPVTTVMEMMVLLWRGQRTRHGSSEETGGVELGQEEAEAAVHLAVTLVHYFGRGLVGVS